MGICIDVSLCSMNTSTQFYTTRFQCRAVWVHHYLRQWSCRLILHHPLLLAIHFIILISKGRGHYNSVHSAVINVFSAGKFFNLEIIYFDSEQNATGRRGNWTLWMHVLWSHLQFLSWGETCICSKKQSSKRARWGSRSRWKRERSRWEGKRQTQGQNGSVSSLFRVISIANVFNIIFQYIYHGLFDINLLFISLARCLF